MSTFTTRPEITGTFGVVTSTHWIATAVGMAILEKGGNAFDAAVATGFVLQIVEPHLNGPAGDLPAIIHSAKTGKTQVITLTPQEQAEWRAAMVPVQRAMESRIGKDLIASMNKQAAK